MAKRAKNRNKEELCVREFFGRNSHTIDDVLEILRATGNEGLIDDAGQNSSLKPTGRRDMLIFDRIANSQTININTNDGLKVHLRRPPGWMSMKYGYNVFSIVYVEARTWDNINRFVVALEGLEATRAQQILDSWESNSWSTDLLRRKTNTQIMLVDNLVDTWSDGNIVNSVELISAFTDENDSIIQATVRRTILDHLPDQECVEHIADRFGPYEFVSLESARIARDVWNVFRNDTEVIDCMIHGLQSINLIRKRQDWSDWKNPYPFGFLAKESP